ncbi:MAG TPA: ABC transporter permease [Thermoanaerobaculia bacterium]|nr:ABC transporter permease [Thermoanaerobaculia bacterium]
MLRVHWLEFKSEFLKMLRLPAYVIPTLAFPVMFYVFFAIVFGQKGIASYLIATYGAFGIIGASLFGFGVSVAIERGQGWLSLKRATPMPLSAWFGAKIGMAFLFSAIIVVLLSILGIVLGGVHFAPAAWAMLFAVLVGGALPFCAMGLMIAYAAGPNSAPAIVNIVYLPMSFLSGLWIPIEVMPKFLQHIAPAFPPFHLAQLALIVIGQTKGNVAPHIAALAGFTALFLVAATIAYRRDEGKVYG